MTKKDKPHASIVAFREAQKLAALSSVARFELGAADLSGCTELAEFYNNTSAVRRALIKSHRANRALNVTDDYDGEAFQAALPEDKHDEFMSQLSDREEAGYLYGLALGLLLGRGGVR